MLFLADESLEAPVVEALRSAGNDVVAVAEGHPGADDDVVLELARSETASS